MASRRSLALVPAPAAPRSPVSRSRGEVAAVSPAGRASRRGHGASFPHLAADVPARERQPPGRDPAGAGHRRPRVPGQLTSHTIAADDPNCGRHPEAAVIYLGRDEGWHLDFADDRMREAQTLDCAPRITGSP